MAKAVKTNDTTTKTDIVLLEFTLSDEAPTSWYAGKSVGYVVLQSMTPQQKQGLRLLFNGLAKQHATLANGKPIHSPADAMKFALEQIAGA